MKLDPTDRAILITLQDNAKLTNAELADRVHLSASACLRRTKLLEESQELAQAADRDELLGELADVSEVLRAITAAHGFSLEEVEAARLKKKDARGGFDDRVFNAAVSAPEGAPALDYYLARPGQYPLDDA